MLLHLPARSEDRIHPSHTNQKFKVLLTRCQGAGKEKKIHYGITGVVTTRDRTEGKKGKRFGLLKLGERTLQNRDSDLPLQGAWVLLSSSLSCLNFRCSNEEPTSWESTSPLRNRSWLASSFKKEFDKAGSTSMGTMNKLKLTSITVTSTLLS